MVTDSVCDRVNEAIAINQGKASEMLRSVPNTGYEYAAKLLRLRSQVRSSKGTLTIDGPKP